MAVAARVGNELGAGNALAARRSAYVAILLGLFTNGRLKVEV